MKTAILRNDILEITIAKPAEAYTGSRFDWTGIITEISYRGHSFCVPEQYEEGKGSGGIGFCTEFGIDKPIGYDDLSVGGEFLKIGAGLVTKKADTPYNFFEPAPLRGLEIKEEFWTNEKYKIVSELNDGNGYNVLLTKIISIEDNLLTIYYFLENEGSKNISTNEYNHNFIGIDNDFIGQNYILTIPSLKRLDNVVGDFKLDGQTITWDSQPSGDFYAIVQLGLMDEIYNWEIKHLKSKVGVRELSTFPIAKAAFWGYSHVVCPELFINIDLESNSTMSWKRCYEFFDCE